jgi:hypothetical protein
MVTIIYIQTLEQLKFTKLFNLKSKSYMLMQCLWKGACVSAVNWPLQSLFKLLTSALKYFTDCLWSKYIPCYIKQTIRSEFAWIWVCKIFKILHCTITIWLYLNTIHTTLPNEMMSLQDSHKRCTPSKRVVFNLFCSRTPTYNFSSTFYPQSCWFIIQVIHSL